MGDKIQEEMMVGRIQVHIHKLKTEKVLSSELCKKCMKCLMSRQDKDYCKHCTLMLYYLNNNLDCIHKDLMSLSMNILDNLNM